MDDFEVFGSQAGSALTNILESDGVQPGIETGYEICKLIYLYHPIGGKMVDRPVKMAMNEARTVHVAQSFAFERRLRDAFEKEWQALNADAIIGNAARVSRIYGTGVIAMLISGEEDTNAPVDFETLYTKSLSFNVLDPLNTSGSIVLNQDPNNPDFQKVTGIKVASKPYHSSRCALITNEDPIYLAYNPAAFGYTGRSVYQRALYPLKSFVQTMRADDMVAVKAGLLVTKIKQASGIINSAMASLSAMKRVMLKKGSTGQVLQIGSDDSIESINLQNLEKPLDTARSHIIANIAAAADMPAILLNSQTFTDGFGEGTEDAKSVAVYIDDIRKWLEPLYKYFIRICQYRAWSPEFVESLKAEFPEFEDSWSVAFTKWTNNFEYKWPDSIKEPMSEKVKVDETRFKAIVSMLEVMLPQLSDDPSNRAALIRWGAENANMNEALFAQRLDLDYEELEFNPPQQAVQEPAVENDL